MKSVRFLAAFRRSIVRERAAGALTGSLLGLLVVSAASSAVGSAHFPNVSGSNLNGEAFSLPKDFRAPLNLVFVAYRRDQQPQVDGWMAAANDAKARRPDLAVWELPTLSRSDGFFRGFIDGGMRRGIPDVRTRAATITLYIDKRAFNDALQITSESTISAVLVRPSGEVLWRAAGAFSPESGAALNAALAREPAP
jgi:hypothetical protein